MRIPFFLVLLSSTVWAAPAVVPIEDFAKQADCSDVQLSPDGRYLAFLRQSEDVSTLFFASLETMKKQPIRLGNLNNTPIPLEARRFRWINDKRIILSAVIHGRYLARVFAVDRNAKNSVTLSLNESDDAIFSDEVLHAFQDGSVLMLDRKDVSGSGLRLYPDVVKVNTASSRYRTATPNPGNVLRWFADGAGRVRMAITDARTGEDILYRATEEQAWSALPEFEGLPKFARPRTFAAGGGEIIFSGASDKKRWAVYRVDTAKKSPAELLFEHPVYDVGPYSGAPDVDGLDASSLVLARSDQRLMGIRYVDERPQVKWLDENFAKIQDQVDASLPGTINMIQSVSTDERTMLVFAFSDRDPGTYYLYDRAKGDLTGLLKTRSWIDPEAMGTTYPIKYTARDGLEIQGYLTVPPGCKPRDLPTVILPHGGPWVRDVWGFDPWVQFLATRGYAVLQMNYRGSAGYGREFSRKGEKEVGGAIQDDIEDATRWAISKKIADPKRIAIMGGSYGGYSALHALSKSADLYRCGISINGVTDWVKMFKTLNDEEYKFARGHWMEAIGDPSQDEERLRAISPVYLARDISAPVLLVQGEKDRVVPQSQAKQMAAALTGAGRRVQTVYLPGEGHYISGEKGRLEMLKRIESFLAEHLAAPAVVAKDKLQ